MQNPNLRVTELSDHIDRKIGAVVDDEDLVRALRGRS